MTPRRRADKKQLRTDGAAERELLGRCLRALERLVPLENPKFTLDARIASTQIDARLEFRLDGQQFHFVVEMKRGLQAAHLGPLVHRARELAVAGKTLIVCADRVPDVRGQELREAGVGYLDQGGNAFLRGPGLYLLVTGQPAVAEKPGGALHGTAVRLLGVFLRDPDAGEVIQKELAARAGIALGAVGRAREQLEQLHVLTRMDKRRWRVTDRDAGLRRFADGWAAVIRPKLQPTQWRGLGRELLERRLGSNRRLHGCLLGGERAAAVLTQHLRTEHATLHVPTGRRAAITKELRLVPDDDGPITVVTRYGTGDEYLPPVLAVPLVHPLLVWAECRTVPDERVAQVAAELYERYLEAAP